MLKVVVDVASSSELKLGCLNVQSFRTAQVQFSELIDSFDIFAISEHCPFAEQLEILEASTNYTYNCIAVSSEDNLSILSGKPAHGGVALFWKTYFNDFIKPLENIDSNRINWNSL